MPYPNEHSCRLQPPGKYDRFRRETNFQGSGYDVIWGMRTEGGKTVTEMQAIRYPKDKWDEARARNHCGDKGGSFEAAAKTLVLTKEQGEALAQLIKQGKTLVEALDKFLVVEDLQEQIRTAEVWDCTDPAHPVLLQLMKIIKKILKRRRQK